MYCTNCGKPIPDGSGFCENCGAKVSTPQSENVQNQAAPPETESRQSQTTPPETESSQSQATPPETESSQSQTTPPETGQQQTPAAAEKKSGFFTPGKITLYVLVLLALVLLIWGIVSAASHSDKTAAEPTAQAQNAEPVQYTLETGAVIKEFDDWHIITPGTNVLNLAWWGVDTEELDTFFESGDACAFLAKQGSTDRIVVWTYVDNIVISYLDELPDIETFAQNMAKGAKSLGFTHVSYEIHKINGLTYVQILGDTEYGSVVEEITIARGNFVCVDYQYDSSSGVTVDEAKDILQKFLSNITY